MDFHAIPGGEQTFVCSQAGEGPDAVLIHGFPDTPHSFSDVQAALAAGGWRVTVPWLRGYHPNTIVPGRGYDPETLGRDVLELLDAIGASRALIVGHDWGALSAYAAAALAPERVAGIAAIGVPHPSTLSRTPAALWSVRHFFLLKAPWAASSCRRANFAYFDRLYRRWAPNWSGPEREESVERAKQALSSPQTLNGAISYYRDLPLGRVALLEHPPHTPGLIIGGTRDVASVELYERTAARMPPPSRALIVERAGHWPHREAEAVVVAELLAWARELGVSADR